MDHSGSSSKTRAPSSLGVSIVRVASSCHHLPYYLHQRTVVNVWTLHSRRVVTGIYDQPDASLLLDSRGEVEKFKRHEAELKMRTFHERESHFVRFSSHLVHRPLICETISHSFRSENLNNLLVASRKTKPLLGCSFLSAFPLSFVNIFPRFLYLFVATLASHVQCTKR